jgi:hypothetical protein
MQPGQFGRAWIERVVGSRPVRATYASLMVHVLALLLLALLVGGPQAAPRPLAITVRIADPPDPAAHAAGVQFAAGDAAPPGPADPVSPAAEPDGAVPRSPPSVAEPPAATTVIPPPRAASLIALAAATPEPAPEPRPLPQTIRPSRREPSSERAFPDPAGGGGQKVAHPFAGRDQAGRARGVETRGGSAASEAAVARGLEWLARHQATDGSWRFDLADCRCDGACRNPGSVRSTTAATGIALLPFLGAGQTHERGEHAQTVTRGLYYLMSRMQATPRGGDLSEGTMYGHGAATLALAEALGMTGDRMLLPYVRDAVRFLETSQDMHGGGWRYLPGQPGDTTVTAWQLAALKSAALAGVAVPSPTIHGICEFLDRVQVRGGEGYGYLAPQDRPCTSAIGLLCRIYTSWPEQATLDRGLARLAARGPDREAVYQNFYLAQALLLREHAAWPRWNAKNRDQLVARQERVGHEAGSWAFADPDTAPGGRLGHTALALLTLEVYYRLLPIYTDEAAALRW